MTKPGKKNKYLFNGLEISPHLYFYLRDVLNFEKKLQVANIQFLLIDFSKLVLCL